MSSKLKELLLAKQEAEQAFMTELYYVAGDEADRLLSRPRRGRVAPRNSELLMEVREVVGELADFWPVKKGNYDAVIQAAINDTQFQGPLGLIPHEG